MRPLDRLFQKWRLRRAATCLPQPLRLIDIGANQGELFQLLGGSLQAGFGVDPLLAETVAGPNFTVRPGYFPEVGPPGGDWDAVTLLAVLEHIPRDRQALVASACFAALRPGGRAILTVPGRGVDSILAVLRFLRLVDGMALGEHFGFDARETPQVFQAAGFRLLHYSRFQLGLNHLFVFEKPGQPGPG